MERMSRGRRIALVILLCIIVFGVGTAVFATFSSKAATADASASEEATASDSDAYGLVHDGVLTVSADLEQPPLEYSSGEETDGFAYDLLGLIADRLGVELRFEQSSWIHDLTDPLTDGTADLIATPTLTGSAYVGLAEISDAYLDVDQCVAVMKSSDIESADDLAGKDVAVVKNSVGEKWALANIDQVRIHEYESVIYALSALRSGNVDGVVGDFALINYNCRVKYGNERIIQVMDGEEQYSFLITRGNTELLDAVNQALADIIESGEYDELYDEWFGGDNEVSWDDSDQYRRPSAMGDAVHISAGQ